MEYYISKKIAEIARDNGFSDYTDKVYDLTNKSNDIIDIGEIIGDNELYAPSYQQLIEWIFNFNVHNSPTYNQKNKYIKWLEFWYNILIPELKHKICQYEHCDYELIEIQSYEPYNDKHYYSCDNCDRTYNLFDGKISNFIYEGFIGMLLNQFEDIGYRVQLLYSNKEYGWFYLIKYKIDNIENLVDSDISEFKTKQQATHESILKTFYLLKNETIHN